MVVSELRGEKIDIIPWNNEPARFVAKALSPARVREVYIDDETKEATVVVPDDQLALAIGKEGLNARLAARLTGWKVDIQSDTEFAQAEAEAAFSGAEGDDFTGRCVAILSTGKRCPNAALPGSRFCGVPAHQELAKREAAGEDIGDQIVQMGGAEDEEAEGAEEVAAEVAAEAVAEEPSVGSAGPQGSVPEVTPEPEPEVVAEDATAADAEEAAGASGTGPEVSVTSEVSGSGDRPA
jgi:transcription termination/antitermination protein NusA